MSQLYTPFNVRLVRAKLRVGDIEGAQAKFEDVEQSSPAGLAARRGTLPYLRGLVADAQGHHDVALKHFEEAIRGVLRPLDLYYAQRLEVVGKAYLATGKRPDLERGRQLLAEVIDFYRVVGAPRFEARAMQLLTAAEDRS